MVENILKSTRGDVFRGGSPVFKILKKIYKYLIKLNILDNIRGIQNK